MTGRRSTFFHMAGSSGTNRRDGGVFHFRPNPAAGWNRGHTAGRARPHALRGERYFNVAVSVTRARITVSPATIGGAASAADGRRAEHRLLHRPHLDAAFLDADDGADRAAGAFGRGRGPGTGVGHCAGDRLALELRPGLDVEAHALHRGATGGDRQLEQLADAGDLSGGPR